MSQQSTSNFLAAANTYQVIKYVIDLDIVPVWEDGQGVILDPFSEGSILCSEAELEHFGMLEGVRWSFTGDGAKEFFISAQKRYLTGSSNGLAVNSFPLTMNLAVPADFIEADDFVSIYLDGFEIGVGKMLALHLQAVGTRAPITPIETLRN